MRVRVVFVGGLICSFLIAWQLLEQLNVEVLTGQQCHKLLVFQDVFLTFGLSECLPEFLLGVDGSALLLNPLLFRGILRKEVLCVFPQAHEERHDVSYGLVAHIQNNPHSFA